MFADDRSDLRERINLVIPAGIALSAKLSSLLHLAAISFSPSVSSFCVAT